MHLEGLILEAAPVAYAGYSSLNLTTVAIYPTTGFLGTTSVFTSSFIVGEGYFWTSIARTSLDLAAQAAVNGAGEVDVFDGLFSGFMTPGYSAIWGGAVDVKPFSKSNQKIQVVGYTKSVNNAFIDGSLKYTFGSFGPVGNQTNKVANGMKNLGVPQLSFIINAPFSLGGKIASKEIKKGL